MVNYFAWRGLLAALVTLRGIFCVTGLTYYWIPQLVLRSSEARASGLRFMGAGFVVVGGLTGYLSFAS